MDKEFDSFFGPPRELIVKDRESLKAALLELHTMPNRTGIRIIVDKAFRSENDWRDEGTEANKRVNPIGTHLIAAGVGILVSIVAIIILDMRRLDFYPYEDIMMLSIGPLFIIAGLSRLKS